VNLGVKKSSGPTERFNAEVFFNFTNVLNHNRFLDSTFNIASGERADGVSTIRCLKGKARLAFPFLFLNNRSLVLPKNPARDRRRASRAVTVTANLPQGQVD